MTSLERPKMSHSVTSMILSQNAKSTDYMQFLTYTEHLVLKTDMSTAVSRDTEPLFSQIQTISMRLSISGIMSLSTTMEQEVISLPPSLLMTF